MAQSEAIAFAFLAYYANNFFEIDYLAGAKMSDVEALSTIVGILRDLEEKDQIRILSAVETFLGIGGHRSGIQTPVQQYRPEVLAPESSASAGPFSRDRTVSPKEFLRDKSPMSDVERVACLAYYLTHFRETPHFKTVDISSLNVEAAQPKFANASAAVDNARARGYLVPSTQGNKQLSAVGERYVENLPDREAAKSSMQVKVKRTQKKARIKKN